MNYGDELRYRGWAYKLGHDPVPHITRDNHLVWCWAWKAVRIGPDDPWQAQHEKFGHFWAAETQPDANRMQEAETHCRAFIDQCTAAVLNPEKLFAHFA